MKELPVTPPLAKILEGWEEWLAHNKRASRYTLISYRHDAQQFLIFLSEHLGGRVAKNHLGALQAKDFRA